MAVAPSECSSGIPTKAYGVARWLATAPRCARKAWTRRMPSIRTRSRAPSTTFSDSWRRTEANDEPGQDLHAADGGVVAQESLLREVHDPRSESAAVLCVCALAARRARCARARRGRVRRVAGRIQPSAVDPAARHSRRFRDLSHVDVV